MKYLNFQIDEKEWTSSESIELEPTAEDVVKSEFNSYVLAGPGAGKTELLAQRASFLLQTNNCSYPERILAISFKKDARRNLHDRVKMRCGDDLASRFVSHTYDSFAKSLVDRFRLAIPERYRPDQNYEINFTNQIITKSSEFNRKSLSFLTICRLAKYLINENPLIKKALTSSYKYVFLDEFQDTTNNQYDLIQACFLGSRSIITAVGDEKQRIMVWAGADKEVFKKFASDFRAKEMHLHTNYRSAPRLVEVQKVLSKKITDRQAEIEVSLSKVWGKNDGICQVWTFEDNGKEAEVVSEQISQWVFAEKLKPEEICIITKQKSYDYAKHIIGKLSEYGINVRDEAKYQDLLSEECVSVILGFILITFSKAPKEYMEILPILKSSRGLYINFEEDIEKNNKVHKQLKKFLEELKKDLYKVKNENDMMSILEKIMDFVGVEFIKSLHPQYKSDKFFSEVLNKISILLYKNYSGLKKWDLAIRTIKGEGTIPLMTIHKSKGLEYHTVVFVGLEDGAFWSFLKQKQEDICAFFVALSRGKVRVIFTFSKNRDFGSNPVTIKNISTLYEILRESGVVTEKTFI